jgi:hypothetical protein
MSTGPTGSTEPIESVMAGYTGVDISLFPTAATGTVEDPNIASMDELMASLGAIVSKETADKQTVSSLLHQTRETLRAPLFQWAAIGFPDIWVIQSFTIDPPPICSDGESRVLLSYFDYCLGKPLSEAIDEIQLKLTGIKLSMSFQGNTLRLHVSR